MHFLLLHSLLSNVTPLFTCFLPIFMVARNVHWTFLNRWQASPHQGAVRIWLLIVIVVAVVVIIVATCSTASVIVATIITDIRATIAIQRGIITAATIPVAVHEIIIDIGDILQGAAAG